jgi:integrase
VELGFLEFVELRQKQGAVKLFSTLKEMKGRPDKRTDTFSKWWSRYTKKIGVKPLGEAGEQKTFHSFRHTSKRALRNAGAPENLVDAIHGIRTRASLLITAGTRTHGVCLAGAL